MGMDQQKQEQTALAVMSTESGPDPISSVSVIRRGVCTAKHSGQSLIMRWLVHVVCTVFSLPKLQWAFQVTDNILRC